MAKRQSRSVLHALVYASLPALTVYAVLDLWLSEIGLINIDARTGHSPTCEPL